VYILEVEDRAENIGGDINDYIQTMEAQAQILTKYRDAGFTFHHRGQGAFWFMTEDADLAAKHGATKGQFETDDGDGGASIEPWLADARRE
jgi:hypothetical protein